MEYTDSGKKFLEFINEVRQEKGYTLRQLCEGLCSHSTTKAMENGCWEPDKFLQENILERLGVAAEDYIRGLDYVDYGRWVDRTHILHSITFCQPDRAARRLAEYEKKYGVRKGHEWQFWLAMKAQVRRCQGCPEEELSGLFREAVELTVPGWEDASLGPLALSVKELNLILEAEHYRRVGERTARYREIVEYIRHSGFDGVGMAKIYPKAVYFLCRSAAEAGEDEGWDTGSMLRDSGDAIEVLREHERMYYLWELVKLRGELARERAEELMYRGKREKSAAMAELSQEMAAWQRTLEETYAERGVPKETFEFCYLYVMKGVYCINDVIRIRRSMLGLSQREVCKGICDDKTLRRIEKKTTCPQKSIALQLMERLGLPGELTRTELVTESLEARELMTELRELVNRDMWEEAERLRLRIMELVPMRIRCNQQTLMNQEIMIKWGKGELEDGKYIAQMEEALGLTLPYEAFLHSKEIYLTRTEQTIILNRMLALDKEGGEYLTCARRMEEIYQPYIDEELWEGDWNMYEFAMRNVGSEWGNLGQYDKSDYYNEIILEGCLRFRRLSIISKSIYGRWWNYDMRKQKGIPVDRALEDAEELAKCIQFSVMAKDEGREQFYRRKLEAMKKK